MREILGRVGFLCTRHPEGDVCTKKVPTVCRWGGACQGGGTVRAQAPQRQASIPGSCPRLGPLPPASPVASTDQHCTQVLAAGSLDDLCNLAAGVGGWRGMSAAFASGLWAQCGRGARRGPSREPSHRHTTCSPSAQENPPSHSATAARARNERHWAPWLDPPGLCLLPLPQLCSLRSGLQQPEGRVASVRCFSCPSQVSRRGDLGLS